MRRTSTLASVAVALLAATAFANPIPTYVTPSGIAFSDVEVVALGGAAAVIEWVIVRDALRGRVRSEAGLAGVVAAAHLVSYPVTVKVAERMLLRTVYPTFEPSWWYWAQSAELVAVAVEFAVYLAAFRLWRRSPVTPPPTAARLLLLAIAANAVTWSFGMAWSAWNGRL